MADPFIGEITMFGGNFAPRNWAFCNGQLINIAQNTALFSLVGTTYGGDGRNTFAVPNLQGRSAMHKGNGPGLTPRQLGQSGGVTDVTLSLSQIPAHTHSVNVFSTAGDDPDPAGRQPASTAPSSRYKATTNLSEMADLQPTGGSPTQSHNNRQPYLAVNFIIALIGTFPSRN